MAEGLASNGGLDFVLDLLMMQMSRWKEAEACIDVVQKGVHAAILAKDDLLNEMKSGGPEVRDLVNSLAMKEGI